MKTKDERKWGPDEWDYPQEDAKCHMCGKTPAAVQFLDPCDICGMRTCEQCFYSHSPTICGRCAGEMPGPGLTADMIEKANIGCGRKRPK